MFYGAVSYAQAAEDLGVKVTFTDDVQPGLDSRRKITRYIESLTSAGHAILGQRETLLFGRLTERAPLKRYIYWSQQLLLIFYSASERGDHQGNTMIPYLTKSELRRRLG